MTPLLSDQNRVADRMRRPSKPARFRRDPDSDYPVGYLAQLARPFSSRSDRKTRPAATQAGQPGAMGPSPPATAPG